MKYAVFVPGTMGSILSTTQGEEVWPPTPLEATLGYKRKAKLLQPDLVVGDIVRHVSCFDIYQPIVDTFAAMGYKESGTGDRLHLFPYDWRLDLETLAEQLAKRIDAIPDAATSIALVAHSMGGLVSRLMLETGKFETKPWFKKIDMFVTLATPHLGAPLALARILGLDSAMGLSGADFRDIASDARYPSGYQLLPAPSEAACWDIRPGKPLSDLDIYDPAVGRTLGLDPALVARAAWLHDALGKGMPPAGVRYFYFAGTGHKTATRLNVGTASKLVTRSEDAGDGTVPLWSALPKSGQKQLVVGEHASFFREKPFKAVFFRLFGKQFTEAPINLVRPAATLSVQAIAIRKTDEIELVIAPETPLHVIKGELVLERTASPELPFSKFRDDVPVNYSGPPVPLLKMHLPQTQQTGFYRVRFDGDPLIDKPAEFVVNDG